MFLLTLVNSYQSVQCHNPGDPSVIFTTMRTSNIIMLYSLNFHLKVWFYEHLCFLHMHMKSLVTNEEVFASSRFRSIDSYKSSNKPICHKNYAFEVRVGFLGLRENFALQSVVAISFPNKKISCSNQLVANMSSSPNHKISQYLSTEEWFTLSILSLYSQKKYIYIRILTYSYAHNIWKPIYKLR
jgi:hypothetical protein